MEIARESIFVAAIRSFFRCFFSVLGIVTSLCFIAILYSILVGPTVYEEKTDFFVLPDLQGKHELLSTSTPAILQIKIHGVIGEPHGVTTEAIRDILLDSQSGHLSHNRVKGILLHFNTPGGSVKDSDDIYRLLKEYKEKHQIPIFAFVDGFCASGGMYVAASADQIFATPPSVIGSIGVFIGPFFNVSGAMQKIGVESKTVYEGLDKDMMNPYRSWKPDEDASIKAIVDSSYRKFVEIMVENRPKVDKEKLISQYGAQVFDSEMSQQIGYIDQANVSYEQALAALLQAAKINPSEPYQIVELKPRHNWSNILTNGQSPLFTGKVEHLFNLTGRKAQQSAPPLSYLYDPEKLYH